MKENLTKTISMNGLGVIEEETTYNNQIELDDPTIEIDCALKLALLKESGSQFQLHGFSDMAKNNHKKV
jgi:hypothetical protein